MQGITWDAELDRAGLVVWGEQCPPHMAAPHNPAATTDAGFGILAFLAVFPLAAVQSVLTSYFYIFLGPVIATRIPAQEQKYHPLYQCRRAIL